VFYSFVLHFFCLIRVWHNVEHNPVFDRYLWGYELLAGKLTKSRVALVDSMFPAFPMPWAPKGAEVIGMCTPLVISDLTPEIRINKKYWDSATDAQQYLLLAHELGHCEFWLMHDNKMLDDGCPASLMNSYLPDAECADLHFLDYAIEFYGKVHHE
jgi:hypothetical protein